MPGETMPDDKCFHAINYIPFIGLAMGRGMPQPMITRLLEVGVGAAIIMYASVEVIKAEVSSMKNEIQKISYQVEKVDEKVEQVRRDLYVPRQ